MGVGGCDFLFIVVNFVFFLEKYIKLLLEGCDISEFCLNVFFFDEVMIDGKLLYIVICYGFF